MVCGPRAGSLFCVYSFVPRPCAESIRDIRDPEHPNTLEELSVVDRSSVTVTEASPGTGLTWGTVSIAFTPTVPHCSLASLIGLSIRAKLEADGILAPAPAAPPVDRIPSEGPGGEPPSPPVVLGEGGGGGLLVATSGGPAATTANGIGGSTAGGVPSAPARYYKLDVSVAPGTHATAAEITKQLNDKERCAAALENPNLQRMVAGCMSSVVVSLADR